MSQIFYLASLLIALDFPLLLVFTLNFIVGSCLPSHSTGSCLPSHSTGSCLPSHYANSNPLAVVFHRVSICL